jgi:hypothetical protein
MTTCHNVGNSSKVTRLGSSSKGDSAVVPAKKNKTEALDPQLAAELEVSMPLDVLAHLHDWFNDPAKRNTIQKVHDMIFYTIPKVYFEGSDAYPQPPTFDFLRDDGCYYFRVGWGLNFFHSKPYNWLSHAASDLTFLINTIGNLNAWDDWEWRYEKLIASVQKKVDECNHFYSDKELVGADTANIDWSSIPENLRHWYDDELTQELILWLSMTLSGRCIGKPPLDIDFGFLFLEREYVFWLNWIGKDIDLSPNSSLNDVGFCSYGFFPKDLAKMVAVENL